jgi:hypothetical protein
LITLAVVLLLATLAGFLWLGDAPGYLGNLLAELTGIVISVVIAFLLVDPFISYQREKQWKKVRQMTYRALAAHLCDLTLDAVGMLTVRHYLMGEISKGRDGRTGQR